MQPHTGPETWRDLSSRIRPCDRDVCPSPGLGDAVGAESQVEQDLLSGTDP